MKTNKRLTKDELRALLPKRLNKLGEWYCLIIAQAMTDKTPLVSSDRKFAIYQKYGLELIFNKK